MTMPILWLLTLFNFLFPQNFPGATVGGEITIGLDPAVMGV